MKCRAALIVSCVAAPALGDVPWPEYQDLDLNFRNSGRVDDGQRWHVRLGAAIEREPTYQGSDRSETELEPFLVLGYRAGWGNLFLTGGGLGYSRMLTRDFGIVLQLEAEDTREVEDDARLAGLGDQDEELELDITGRYFFGPLSLGASIAQATGDKGFVWFVGGNYTWRSANERLFVALGADLSGADRENLQTDFGVTAAQSAASGFSEYSPGGGLKSYGIGLNAEYELNERWYLLAGVEYERLLDEAADSPLVLDESAVEAGLALFYRF